MAIPGMQVGSPYYAAPEQGSAPEKADARADLYSIGVLMYRMLTGRLVDPSREPVEAASRLNGELNPEWDAYLWKALAVEPEKRFSDALAMRVALEELFRDWKSVSKKCCPSPDSVKQQQRRFAGPVRSTPARIMYMDMRGELALDELFRPTSFLRHQLEIVSPLVLRDPVTSLFWQRCGAGFTLNWQEAKEYVDYLNETGFERRAGWRLPTTAELVTVLRSPTAQRDFCIDPHFEPTVHWLWSSDHSTKKAAWMADIIESHLGRLDMDGTASVCAVSDGQC
jgi:serine/threonine-protein kinase